MPSIGPASIVYEEVDEYVPHGNIDWIGAAPKSRCTIQEWDQESRSLIPVDRITEATVTETTEGARIVGVSEHTGGKATLVVTRTRRCC